MKPAQSPHIPVPGTRAGLRDLPWLIPYALRGLFELVRARLIFMRIKTRDILARNKAAKTKGSATAEPSEAQLARIAFVLPRISHRLPWRSDCLIQAIAGQNWLSSLGAGSEIQIGVDHPSDGAFEAHAWLVHSDTIVTGGKIDRYHLLLADSRLKREPDPDPSK